jgi:hypothetical protein
LPCRYWFRDKYLLIELKYGDTSGGLSNVVRIGLTATQLVISEKHRNYTPFPNRKTRAYTPRKRTGSCWYHPDPLSKLVKIPREADQTKQSKMRGRIPILFMQIESALAPTFAPPFHFGCCHACAFSPVGGSGGWQYPCPLPISDNTGTIIWESRYRYR